jgi:HAD superfamily hydrolase (TIGR01509 family)
MAGTAIMHRPIIFDFDGVIVDSETIANRAFAECLTAHGFPTTHDESKMLYSGKRMSDCIIAIERVHGRKVPPDFVGAFGTYSFDLLRKQLKPVPGAVDFVRSTSRTRTAIASSSGTPRITLSLNLVGLLDHFDGRIYSAADLARGKPHPDVFLQAAHGLGVEPRDCLVIEDGVLGVQGAVAAGMTVIGLTAGTHCDPAHGDRLIAAGAHVISSSYDEVAAYVATRT